MIAGRNNKTVHINGRKIRIDEGILDMVQLLNNNNSGLITLASCSGHLIHKPSIIVRHKNDPEGRVFDYFTRIEVPRKRRFYRKDEHGLYYIPELEPHRK